MTIAPASPFERDRPLPPTGARGPTLGELGSAWATERNVGALLVRRPIESDVYRRPALAP